MKLKDKYDFTCANCGHEMQFKPSICMEWGINSGHATCSKCNTFLHMEIDNQSQKGISIVWDDYIKQRDENGK